MRDWCYQHVPVEDQDRGANDEGYYRYYCSHCDERTEHETGHCCACGDNNDPGYWD
jgi:hypothetical protein